MFQVFTNTRMCKYGHQSADLVKVRGRDMSKMLPGSMLKFIVNQMKIIGYFFKLSSHAYMRQWIDLALVHIKTCVQFRA